MSYDKNEIYKMYGHLIQYSEIMWNNKCTQTTIFKKKVSMT